MTLLVAVMWGAGLLVVAPAADAQLKALAVTREDSPLAGLQYWEVGNPVASDDADVVAFTAFARTPNGTKPKVRETCVFEVAHDTTGAAQACKKDASGAGPTYKAFREVVTSNAGHVAWLADLNGIPQGIFRDGDSAVVLYGDPVAGGTILDLSNIAIISDHSIIFLARLGGTPSSLDQGVFRCLVGFNCRGGVLELWLQKGEEIDDRPGFEICNIAAVNASDWGIVFKAGIKENCANAAESTRTGIFRREFNPVSGIQTVALEDDAAEPSPQPGGTRYHTFPGRPSIDPFGRVAFQATTKGAIVETDFLYVCLPGCDVAVAEGEADAGGNMFISFTDPVIASSGAIAFTARTRGGSGVYVRHLDGIITTVARSGDIIPGSTPGRFRAFGPASISRGGQIAFKAALKLDVKPKKGQGIFLYE